MSTLKVENVRNPASSAAVGFRPDRTAIFPSLVLNIQTISESVIIPAASNAGMFGPVTLDAGVTVTVPSGSVWTVV